MKLDEIRVIAQKRGIKAGKLNKTQLIRAIQRDEGNHECFATDVGGTCDQSACLWRGDCSTTAQKTQAA